MYYPCSEIKGADQLRGYREADLRLCFRICRLLFFSRGGSYAKSFCNINGNAKDDATTKQDCLNINMGVITLTPIY